MSEHSIVPMQDDSLEAPQIQAWDKEYEKVAGLPTSVKREASAQVVEFLEFLKQKNINTGEVLDIGCGLGRNSLYLATQGFHVSAFDIASFAVESLKKEATRLNLPIITSIQSASGTWCYEDNSFDVAIDICVFDNMVTETMKQRFLSELCRVLRPGAYFCMFAILADDEYYAHLLEQSNKKNAFILHDNANDIWSSMLPKNTLKELLSEYFFIVEVKEIRKEKELMYGKEYSRSLARFIVQKK